MTRTAARTRTGGLGSLAVLGIVWFMAKYHPDVVSAGFDSVGAQVSDWIRRSLPTGSS